jgi:galactitol-specific phosphotransferase system IIB component
MRKPKIQEIKPMMTTFAATTENSPVQARRNLAGDIERTDRFYNIDYGLVPFKYSHSLQNKSGLNIRDAVILCQKAYYNFSSFRNVIDLMTEFSSSKIYFTGGNKKARDFLEALFKKINIDNFVDKFFREYYRSGNVFIYRFDYKVNSGDVAKITQVFGSESLAANSLELPSKYMILNPADIQYGGNISFVGGNYYKILTDYELQRLRNPTTDEDREVLKSLNEKNRLNLQKKVLSGAGAYITIPLDTEQVSAVFYKKQDYEPFSVPMGFPVLEDINWKQEMKKMDMALTRTTQQAVLLITMGSELKSGALNINQKNIEAMQNLFQNQSVGKVLVSDFTTKAQFIIPDIANILDPKKYEVVNTDIQQGLNNILVGDEKFSNTSIKTNIFFQRLEQGRQAFLNDFLVPEVKRLCKNLGFKNFPTPHFEEIDIRDASVWNRVAAQLAQLGVLTPEEALQAIDTGRLPDPDESLESQKKFKALKEEGLYAPIATGAAGGMNTGRPPGAKSPQTSKNVSAPGTPKKAPAIASYSMKGISQTFKEYEMLSTKVEEFLKKKHKKKSLNQEQKSIAEQISQNIIINEEKANWDYSIKAYCEGEKQDNPEKIAKLLDISEEHGVDIFSAAILNISQISQEKV